MKIELTSKKIELLFKLYIKNLDPDTLPGLARSLDGSYKSETYSFLRELRYMSIVTLFRETRRDLGIINGLKHTDSGDKETYIVDKELLIEFWKRRSEFLLSKKILEDSAIVIE